MTSHELAKKLLEGPDIRVAVSRPSECCRQELCDVDEPEVFVAEWDSDKSSIKHGDEVILF